MTALQSGRTACGHPVSAPATCIDTAFAGPLSGSAGSPDDALTQRSPNPTTSAAFLFRSLCGLALGLLLVACASSPDGSRGDHAAAMPSIESLMGDWYVAARVPWLGERGRVAARLSLAGDKADASRIIITRHWRDGFSEPLDSDQTAARRDGPGGRFWKVRAWRVLPARLRVLEAAENGSWLLLDSASHDHAWILTRAQVVGEEAYLELERRIRGHGVNTDKLRRVAQVQEQEGRLGFEPAASPTPGR